jgi:hypothetical protein
MGEGNWTAVAVVPVATNKVDSAGVTCAYHDKKMDGVLLTMAVWMNAAHRTMGGDVGERMEAGG